MDNSNLDGIIALPSEVKLSAGQLKAFLDALESINSCRDEVLHLREENAALKERLTNHSARIVALEIDLDKLLSKDPGKTDTLRVQKLIKYMKDRPDRKASFATLRGVLQVDAPKLRAVIKAADMLDPGRFEVRDDERDRRKSWLFAKR